MIDVTLKSLAIEIHISVDLLIKQFADVGVIKNEMDLVTQHEKEILLTYLNRKSGRIPDQLIVQRKKHITLNIPSTNGKTKLVKIEVRKKRTYTQQFLHLSNHKLDQKNIFLQQQPTIKIIQNNENTSEKIKFSSKDIVENSQPISSLTENNYLIKQKNNIPIQHKCSQKLEQSYHKLDTLELKNKIKESIHHKTEKEIRQISEKKRRIIEEYSSHWNKTPDLIDEDVIDHNATSFIHTRITEDNHDYKIENNKRSKNRNNKNIKQKKINSRISSNHITNFKTCREEIRNIHHEGKFKHQSNILTQEFTKPTQSINRNVVIGETISIAELANKMSIKGSEVIKAMMQLGVMVTINQIIDQETAQLVAEEMNYKVILRRENELEESIMLDRNNNNMYIKKPRAPVVTIMGHVDHGKTSLLDYIRSSKIAIGESGGITQHIGAYHVKTNSGMITFIDTPGHAAFTAMRSRGVQATDIVVLVVSADDKVMPQTIEAIQHAKAAKVPIIVAINKIDKTEANPEQVKKELMQHGIISDQFGGDNQFVHVSAKYGTGIDELLEAILLQAEILELKAIHDVMANGVVIESSLDKGRGPIATVLIREGTLKRGDVVLCGLEYGRIRAMHNEIGKDISSAGPSIPVEILGLSGVPVAGDKITVVRDEKKAREVAFYRQGKFREVKLARQHKLKAENVFVNMIKNEISELNIVLKSDVQGSSEAISNALENLSTPKIKLKIVGIGVGGITETDATLAVASNAILIGFNVRADLSARRIIEAENIDLRYYSVIYDLINEVKDIMNGMLSSEYKEEIIGLAEVRNIFRSPNFGVVAGCMVIHGIVKRHNKIRILRDNTIIYKGELESLRRFKEDVNEVRNGVECGIGIKHYNDIRIKDIIEIFEVIECKST